MELIQSLAKSIAYELYLKPDIDNGMVYEILCSDVDGLDFDCKVCMSWNYTPATKWQPSETDPKIHSVEIQNVWDSEGDRVNVPIDEKLLTKLVNNRF